MRSDKARPVTLTRVCYPNGTKNYKIRHRDRVPKATAVESFLAREKGSQGTRTRRQRMFNHSWPMSARQGIDSVFR